MLKTKIFWSLHDYCEERCFYCPSNFWGGDKPRGIVEYIKLVEKAIQHYKNLGKLIDWSFDGGEPLHYFDFPQILKICKEGGGQISLQTNGGKLWLDWWAIEPHIDHLNLTYHHWQNPNLINFIIDIFVQKNKSLSVYIPMRPGHVIDDLPKLKELELKFNIKVNRQILYENCDKRYGMMSYSDEELFAINGQPLIEEKITHSERKQEMLKTDPSYTGMICNAGIERLYINAQGWVKGSLCNDKPLGNIWFEDFIFPNSGHKCGMKVCHFQDDRQITKFI